MLDYLLFCHVVIGFHVGGSGACDGGNFVITQLIIVAQVESQLLLGGQ